MFNDTEGSWLSKKLVQGYRKKELLWRERLARFTASGQQVAVFCSGEAVSEASFYRWRKLLKGPAALLVRATRFIDAGAMAVAEVSAPAAAVQEKPPEPNLEVRLDLGHGLVPHIVRR